MNKRILNWLFLAVLVVGISDVSKAQTRKGRSKTTRTKAKTQVNTQTPQVDTVPAPPVVVAAPPKDSLPIKPRRKSLRPDEAVVTDSMHGNTSLVYEHLRGEDAFFRHRIWRDIDTREKMNTAFRYAAEEDNGNQRFINIVLQALQDSQITVYNNVDDRFTTPMTMAEVSKIIAGDSVEVPQFMEDGTPLPPKKMLNEINLDSFYKFRIKEEVVFDKESSRLFWRILGIAPIKNVVTSMGVSLGETELFWIYYPDFRKVLVNYEAYNGKNYGARMNWEQLFESRMFYGRIVKSTYENPYDIYIKAYKGLQDNTLMQLYEGENIKEVIFNFEQDVWSY